MNKLFKSIIVLILLIFLGFISIPTIHAGTETSGDTVSLTDPLGFGADDTAPQKIIGRVIAAALGVVGSLALAMFIYGGFTWMLSGGNATAVEKGKNILIWATIGLIIIFFAYGLVYFVMNTVLSGGTSTGT